MSNTLSTLEMSIILNTKLPFGFSTYWWQSRLNEAWRWIEQQGPYNFDLRVGSATFGGSAVTSTLPPDFNTGAEATLWNSSTGVLLQIPYMTADAFRREATHTPIINATDMFSAWTFYGSRTSLVGPTIEVGPQTARSANVLALTLIYHAIPNMEVNVDASTYFPTPDEFDDLIVLRAEAETRLLYELPYALARKKEAEDMGAKLLDRYRSTKRDLAGMVDQVRKTQETQAHRMLA